MSEKVIEIITSPSQVPGHSEAANPGQVCLHLRDCVLAGDGGVCYQLKNLMELLYKMV